jgi:hypothetical protein
LSFCEAFLLLETAEPFCSFIFEQLGNSIFAHPQPLRLADMHPAKAKVLQPPFLTLSFRSSYFALISFVHCHAN